MSTKSKQRGTAAETAVVRYLQNWWPAAERRALSGNKDKGDVAVIPGVVVEVKAAARPMLAAWRREALVEMRNAGASACILVVKRPYKSVPGWDAHVWHEPLRNLVDLPQGAAEWPRMDVEFAVAILQALGY